MEKEREDQAAALAEDAAMLADIDLELGWAAHRRMEQDLAAYNLTLSQYMALRCIHESGSACTMSELAESALQVSATMTGIVDRLVERGLVTRERSPEDRRTLHVALTQEGRATLEKVDGDKHARLAQFLMDLDPQERRLLIKMARRYLQAMQQSINQAVQV